MVNSGSVVGLAIGLAPGLGGSPVVPAGITMTSVSPDGIVVAVTGSDLVVDTTNYEIYKSETAGATDWIRLGSQT